VAFEGDNATNNERLSTPSWTATCPLRTDIPGTSQSRLACPWVYSLGHQEVVASGALSGTDDRAEFVNAATPSTSL
jgi:hypothetical protein